MVDLAIRKLAVYLAGALLVTATSVVADSALFEKGASAYKRGDYETALAVFRPLAENGDSRAQSILALMYAYGEGVPVDDRESARWYRRAAEQNSNVAQFNLGMLYLEGRGVDQDTDEAIVWLTKAADGGHFRARQELQKLDAGTYSSISSGSSESLEAPPDTTASQTPPTSVVMRNSDAHSSAPDAPPPTAAELMKVKIADTSRPAKSNQPTAKPAESNNAVSHTRTDGMQTAKKSATAPTPTPTPQPSSRGERVYRVQLAASRSEENIRRDWLRYQQDYADIFEGLDGSVERAEVGDEKTVWYRLRVGPFASEASAKALCETLDARGVQTGCLPMRVTR